MRNLRPLLHLGKAVSSLTKAESIRHSSALAKMVSPVKPEVPVDASVQPDTSYTIDTRKKLGIHGLTPPNVESYALQAQRCLKQLSSKTTPIEKYIYLSNLRNSNRHLFYRLVLDNFQTLTPLIYTPVVGEACLKWSEIYQQPEGLYISYADRGSIRSVLRNWSRTQKDIEITVITDGSRILGLGDLGINGMGIPVGKLALYTGCAGIRPEKTLPITLDLGTNNEKFLKDPLYMGSKERKRSESEELEFMDELMEGLTEVFPGIVIQFEDFKNPFPALEKYGPIYPCFNDDIQGTGAVILAGIINALKQTKLPVAEQRAVFMGAGSAGVGVAKQIVEYFMKEGLTEEEARRCFWFVDTKGLITNDRGDVLAPHKTYFSRPDNAGKQYQTLDQVIDFVKPTILMGLSTIRGIFSKEILQKMAALNDRPIIFPLSNPSSNAECTFEEAVKHTNGKAVFASGSPFQPFLYKGVVREASQGNNMYVFPGIGLGSILAKSVQISQDMIYASATALSTALTKEEVADGRLYPSLDRIRDVSVIVAREVIRTAQEQGLAREKKLEGMISNASLEKWIRERMYDPRLEVGGGSGEKAKL